VLVVIALLVVRSTSGPSLGSPETEPVAEERVLDLDSPREAPEGGRTADAGFVDVDASNPVYRAWREMAETADGANLRTHTPGEGGATRRRRGMDRDAVRTLTRVFDQARYGPAGVDEESGAARPVGTRRHHRGEET